MSVFNVISLLGGLAMFLYGMRLMSNGLKENSSGALKIIMERVTGSLFKSFITGLLVTAVIQSSTATIVITAGLVAAGVVECRKSVGVIIGANVGTTVTGQIIRLLDLKASATSWLQLLKPSTLAPLALIIGVCMFMFARPKKHARVDGIIIGFGILFSGLLNMTEAVGSLSSSGLFETALASLGKSPVIGYLTGAAIAFALQSSSAAIGILQAFSVSGQLSFKAIYAVLVGIYLGDCVTTAIVCSIGAKPGAKRVGLINIMFNLSETVLVLAAVTLIHRFGLLDALWDKPIFSGGIANTNTVFNLGCALLLLPVHGVYVRLSNKLVKETSVENLKYEEKLSELNKAFFSTPALALSSCYDVLSEMFSLARGNIEKAIGLLYGYNEAAAAEIEECETAVDHMTDRVSQYLMSLSPHVRSSEQIRIVNQYYKVVAEFERLSDHAVNISETAGICFRNGSAFSDTALAELEVLTELTYRNLEYARLAFEKRDMEAAMHIEPLEEVADDLISAMRDNHLSRMRDGKCDFFADTCFTNLLSDMERISDICSNIGLATVMRVEHTLEGAEHEYISVLHQGRNEAFNDEYRRAHNEFFGKFAACADAAGQ